MRRRSGRHNPAQKHCATSGDHPKPNPVARKRPARTNDHDCSPSLLTRHRHTLLAVLGSADAEKCLVASLGWHRSNLGRCIAAPAPSRAIHPIRSVGSSHAASEREAALCEAIDAVRSVVRASEAPIEVAADGRLGDEQRQPERPARPASSVRMQITTSSTPATPPLLIRMMIVRSRSHVKVGLWGHFYPT